MIIMGIDPGLVATGLGVISTDHNHSELLHTDLVRTRASDPLVSRLSAIHRNVSTAVRKWTPDVVVIESLFFAKNVKSAVLLAHARAAALLAASESPDAEVVEYSPLEIKQAVAGYGRAGKDQVARMVAVLLRPSTIPDSEHIADALAAALCHAHRQGRPTLAVDTSSGSLSNAKKLLAMARKGSRNRRR